ncbi:MAG: hypothetical protein ACKVQK_05960 [Burkholderiales bacterium]
MIKILATRRRMVLGLAFVAALTAAMMAPSEEVARVPKRSASAAAPNSAVQPVQRRASREVEIPPVAEFARHIDEKFVVVDIFESRQVAKQVAVVAPQAAPLPPKLPFTYMGRVGEADSEKIVLVEGEKLYLVAKGTEFAASYRLDAVSSQELVLTYLPLNAKQSLAIGMGETK